MNTVYSTGEEWYGWLPGRDSDTKMGLYPVRDTFLHPENISKVMYSLPDTPSVSYNVQRALQKAECIYESDTDVLLDERRVVQRGQGDPSGALKRVTQMVGQLNTRLWNAYMQIVNTCEQSNIQEHFEYDTLQALGYEGILPHGYGKPWEDGVVHPLDNRGFKASDPTPQKHSQWLLMDRFVGT